MKIFNHLTAFDKSQIAKLRLEVIEFYDRFGLQPTLAAYKVSKATLYRWRREFNLSQKLLTSLIPKSTRPRRLRHRQVDSRLVKLISNLREEHYRLGKDKLKSFLDDYCRQHGLAAISISTIGRVIKDCHYCYQKAGRTYHDPGSPWARAKKRQPRTRQKYAPKPKDFGYVEMDSLVKFVDGMKAYLITAVDVKLKFGFCLPYFKLTSRNALDVFKKLEFVYPFTIKAVQTDNGAEFLGEFDDYLEKRQIKHLFTYPRCPRINGVVERFNRTVKEEFLNPNLNLLTRRKLFHDKLMDYLLFFNTKRPHQSLGQRSPLGYALEEGYLSQMYWTSTTP